MKRGTLFFLCAMTVAGVAAAQLSPDAEWTGVWQGELDGQPSVVLTLAEDTGTLGGTVVLNIIEKVNGQARVVAVEPHMLVNPRVGGDALVFQFRKLDGGLLDFTVKRTATGAATIHCRNCGADAPVVNLTRAK